MNQIQKNFECKLIILNKLSVEDKSIYEIKNME